MSARPARSSRLYTLLAGTLALALTVHVLQKQARPEPPFGRYTARQINEKTAALCRIILPQATSLRFTAQPVETAHIRYWNVTYWEENGDEALADLTWNAETGALFSVTCSPSDQGMRGERLLTNAEAVRVAQHWLRVLQVDKERSGWQVARPPVREGEILPVWKMEMKSGARHATVHTTAFSGDLLFAMIATQ